jgi:hypothetical protein
MNLRVDEAPMDHYPMDDISGKTNCEMHQSMKNISMKVAVGYMRYLLDLDKSGMAVRFELAMLMLGRIPWSLTSLDLKRRQNLEKYWVVSFFGIRNTSFFQARRQGGHPLLQVLAIHHPSMMIGTTTRARVYLDLHRSVSRLLRLHPLINPRVMESPLLCPVVMPLRRNVGPRKSRRCRLLSRRLLTKLRWWTEPK